MNCDLDIYVLDSTCDPDGGCVAGSTNANNTDDSVYIDTTGATIDEVVARVLSLVNEAMSR